MKNTPQRIYIYRKAAGWYNQLYDRKTTNNAGENQQYQVVLQGNIQSGRFTYRTIVRND